MPLLTLPATGLSSLPLLMTALWLAAPATVPGAVPAQGAEVSLRGLIAEMADLERLALYPDPPHVTRQSSSYDRASRSREEGESWFANADQGNYLRVEKDPSGSEEFVMMDAEGPGAIVRIWSADPKGTIRIYLDGGGEPALAAPMADLLAGRVSPFVPPLAGERARGANLHFPIPYRKRCKVTGDRKPFYYQVNYRTYPPETEVETFSSAKLAGLQPEIDRVISALSDPAKAAPQRRSQNRALFGVGIPPGESRTIFTIDKGGAIREIRLSLGTANAAEVLRKCVLTCRFDGEERPSIWAPVGDFFGSAPGLNPYASLPLGVRENGEMYCHWVMPFEREARFEIRNLAAEEVNARGSYLSGPFPWSERALRFHARFRVEHDMPTRPMRDWTYLEAGGKGVFVGNALSVANPVKAWWGEGDEKIYVDGEAFPSHFGTGTEDYYGYAWCHNQPFHHAYHNQTRVDGPRNFGHTSVNRWHIIDDIPFTRSFRFDMEVWHWNESARMSYAATSYWYARPSGTDRAAEYASPDLRVPDLPELKAVKVEGALEGEKLKAVASGGVAETQDMEPFEGAWSGDAHLWWRGAKPGDELKLEFPAPRAGRFRLTAVMTRAVDYGIHQLSVNGEKAGEPVDLFNRGVMAAPPLELGSFELKQGPNELAVKVVGTNPAAQPANHMFGLDYLLLKPE